MKSRRYVKPFKSYCRFRSTAAIFDLVEVDVGFLVDSSTEKRVPESGGGRKHWIRVCSLYVGEVNVGANLQSPNCLRYKKLRCSRVKMHSRIELPVIPYCLIIIRRQIYDSVADGVT